MKKHNRKYKYFWIYGEKMFLPTYRKGDRVRLIPNDLIGDSSVYGTVTKIIRGGVYIEVSWDINPLSSSAGSIHLPFQSLVSTIQLLEEE